VNWCDDNNVSFNVNKMKQIVIDFRERSGGHALVYINGDEVKMVESFKFLGVQITNNLTWSFHADAMVKMPLLSQKTKEIWHVCYDSHNFYRCTKKAFFLVVSQLGMSPALSKTARNYKGS